MELLYVWVKEYRNIKNQGFNFNPRYHFTYNPDNNELSLDEHPDAALPAGFFGENITNVTAIVGENGTGKSGLLDRINKYNRFVFAQDENYLKIYSIYGKLVIYSDMEIEYKIPCKYEHCNSNNDSHIPNITILYAPQNPQAIIEASRHNLRAIRFDKNNIGNQVTFVTNYTKNHNNYTF